MTIVHTQVSRADSFDFESLKLAQPLTRFFSLAAKLSQPNPHTHSLKRERTLGEEVEACIAYSCFPWWLQMNTIGPYL